VNGDGIIDTKMASDALNMMEIDYLGLDPADRNMLKLMYENYGDRPVGLNTIAALTGDEAATIEDFYEPYLMQMGLLMRTPKGRVVTEKGKKHLQEQAQE
jgi:Holliday junction DNA helicase RuvB